MSLPETEHLLTFPISSLCLFLERKHRRVAGWEGKKWRGKGREKREDEREGGGGKEGEKEGK